MMSLVLDATRGRIRLAAGTVDALAAAACLLLVGALTMLTPAFTDYEAEIEPALRAFMAGDLQAAFTRLPVYGGSVLAEVPFAGLGHAIGGDLWMYRLAAIPGAALMIWLATLAARWLRHAGRPRTEQLGAVALIAASPCISRAWTAGHHEEILVAGLAAGGFVLLTSARAQVDRRQLIVGAALLGAACGGKLWPLLLVPVALAATRRRGDAALVLGVTLTTAAVVVAPAMVAQLTSFRAGVAGLGDQIFSTANAWWFFGARNPNWIDPDSAAGAARMAEASYRLGPGIVAYAHELMLALSTVLAAAWWWRAARSGLAGRERAASLLLLAGAVVWWRGLLDPWFQAYYLAAALALWTLADARRGRFPVAAGIAWVLLWLTYGPSAVTTAWSQDAVSAVGLAWTLPLGVWSTVRALRSAGCSPLASASEPFSPGAPAPSLTTSSSRR